ncbi:MAG: hypothetical protein J0L92_08780 [Deltaproteobacteria bacterium]|nr:hypothetical protein [Deltaproteobacteria bacterium]
MIGIVRAALVAMIVVGGGGTSGCASGSLATPRPAAPSPAHLTLDWAPGAFSLVLGGETISMDTNARLHRGGLHFATLEPDGRVVDPSGQSIATLLPDGQIAYRGNLSTFRILADLPSLLSVARTSTATPMPRQTVVRASHADFVVLEEDTVTVLPSRGGAASGTVTWGSPAHERVRPVLVLAVLVDRLEQARARVAP